MITLYIIHQVVITRTSKKLSKFAVYKLSFNAKLCFLFNMGGVQQESFTKSSNLPSKTDTDDFKSK